jgi:AcrR family transcriptional regulator
MITKSKLDKKAPRKVLQERRDRILEAAVEVFAEKGIDLATIEDIADRAGVGRGTVYRRVGRKEDFLELLMKDIGKFMFDNLKSAINKRTDPIMQFKEIINAFCDVMETKAHHMMIIMLQVMAQANKGKVNLKKFLSAPKELIQIQQLIENVIHRAIKKGQFRPVNVPATARGLIESLNPMYYQYLHAECNYTKSEIAQMTIDLYLNGLKPRK